MTYTQSMGNHPKLCLSIFVNDFATTFSAVDFLSSTPRRFVRFLNVSLKPSVRNLRLSLGLHLLLMSFHLCLLLRMVL